MIAQPPNRTGSSSRRSFLWNSGGGLGGIALASLLGAPEAQAAPAPGPLWTPRARRVVQLFMAGGASAIDLFDHKPELERRHGQPSDFGEKVEAFQDGVGPWLRPAWSFARHGACGKAISEVVSDLGPFVDQMAFVHNMTGRTGVHSQGTLLQTTGFNRPGFPGMGAWVSYGLGSIQENLPTFVVLPDVRGLPSNGVKNWDAAFLPGRHAGTIIRCGAEQPIHDLQADARFAGAGPDASLEALSLLARLDRRHADARAADERLEARIQAYELAARMQLAAPEALDISREPESIRRMYGIQDGRSWPKEINDAEEIDAFGRKCLTARRLLERGVRFVQVWSGNDNGHPRRNWDSHEDIRRDHGPLARGFARGTAALLRDLGQRGMLDDTLVLWTTEFGRLPSSQGGKGRDHNPFCFTNWLCGGGIRGGVTVGESDAFGYKPLDRARVTEVYDIHATVLHLLGLDHERLTVRAGGVDRRLTDVHGHVVRDLLA